MPAYFFDTSALAKRWIREAGSLWVRAATARDAGNEIVVARLALPEIGSALAGRQRAGDLDARRLARILATARREFARRFAVVELSAEVLDRATDLVVTHPLRASDAVHLAAAMLVRTESSASGRSGIEVVASDVRLVRAATAEGFRVIVPTGP